MAKTTPSNESNSSTPGSDELPNVKRETGSSWKDSEAQVLPENQLGIVLFGLSLSVYVSVIFPKTQSTPLRGIAVESGAEHRDAPPRRQWASAGARALGSIQPK